MGRLKRTQEVDRAPLYAPLVRLLDDVFVDGATLAARYGYTATALVQMRRRNRSYPWVRTPSGGIRYPVGAIVSHDLANMHGGITADRVKLVILGTPHLSEAQKADLCERVDKAFSGG